MTTRGELRVPLGYAVGLVVLILARPVPALLGAGCVLAAAGEAVRLWASGHIEKTRSLATGGPYAHSRNPLYFGSILMGLGIAVASSSGWVAVALGAYFAAFYPSAMRSEAEFLRGKFPQEYEEWSRRVPFFFPRLTPAKPSRSCFEWARVRMNREWRTAAALPAVALVLYLRSLW